MSFDIREHDLPLPKGWSYKKISDVAKVNVNTIRKKNAPDEIYYIDISSVSNGSFEPPKHMLYADAPSRAKRIVKKNDFIISTVRPNLKQYVFLDEVHENWIASTGFAVVTAIEAGTEWYLYSVITSELFNEHLVRVADGGAYPAFNPKEIEDAVIFWPDEDSLRVINDLAFNLNTKQKNNTKTNQALEQIAQAIFKSWFVDFDPVKAKIETLAQGGSAADAELAAMSIISAKTLDELNSLKANNPEAFNKLAQTAALFPDAMQDSELGEIPEGWVETVLYDIADYINGAAYKKFEPNSKGLGLPIVKIAELKSGITDKTGFSTVRMPDKYRLADKDILFSWSGNPDTSIDTFVWALGDAWLNQHIFKVVPKPGVNRTYILSLLKFMRPVFAEIARDKQTTGLGHVTVKDLQRLKVALPTEYLLTKFDEKVGEILTQNYNLVKQNQTIEKLRDTLLPKLLTGEIDLNSEVIA